MRRNQAKYSISPVPQTPKGTSANDRDQRVRNAPKRVEYAEATKISPD